MRGTCYFCFYIIVHGIRPVISNFRSFFNVNGVGKWCQLFDLVTLATDFNFDLAVRILDLNIKF